MLLAVCLTLLAPASSAQTPILKILMDATKSVVKVDAQSGSIVSSPPHYVQDKQSRIVVEQRKVSPIVASSEGAGVIVDRQGIIITNAHTVRGAAKIAVTFFNGKTVAAKLVYFAPQADLAVLLVIPPFDLVVLPLADGGNIHLEQRVFTIGTSQLLRNTLSEGRISGLGIPKIFSGNAKEQVLLLQITFDLYQGDSGSPLVNEDGKLLGIMTAASRARGKEAYAIPCNRIIEVLQAAAQTSTP